MSDDPYEVVARALLAPGVVSVTEIAKALRSAAVDALLLASRGGGGPRTTEWLELRAMHYQAGELP